MSKKKLSLGKSLIKAHKRESKFVIQDGYRHTCDLPDGRDFARLKSITEQNSLDDFLYTAQLAEKDYNSEFANIQLVDPDEGSRMLSETEKKFIEEMQNENKDILCIPRRPFWDANTSKEELDVREKEIFLNWRKTLAKLQENEYINLTPYEKNLEIWRQLWRVIERSEVIVQIIDARNPLLFRCSDLEDYVKEVNEEKQNVLLLNKADFLTETQRKHWCEYFDKNGIQIAFFSALQQMQLLPENIKEDPDETNFKLDLNNKPDILSREELISFLKNICKTKSCTIGMVGYPNVGKSSTINALLMSKKVSVSSTPGKTKHFQTHIIDKDFCLCDCPGLVFPNFVSTKADMVINGILPIDQLTNWVEPISLITNIIPRNILESTYSIIIPPPNEGRAPDAPPTAEEFLNAHGYMRGFMTQRGIPDNARSARYILKDFVNGKLLYCYAPPGIDQNEFHKFPETKKKLNVTVIEENEDEIKPKPKLTSMDRNFFSKANNQIHIKGVKNITPRFEQQQNGDQRPSSKKHYNRNRKEKLRRLYKNPYE